MVDPEPLTVVIEQRSVEALSEISVPEYERRAVLPDISEDLIPEVPVVDVHEDALTDDPIPARDWYEIAREPVRQSIDEFFANEESRKKMWRQTGSVMFRDTGQFDFREPESIIAAREFRRPVGVLGIGLTIGGCFFGIPLAGIPVEERGVGPNVIYCTDIYE